MTFRFSTNGEVTHEWWKSGKIHWKGGLAKLITKDDKVYIEVKNEENNEIKHRHELSELKPDSFSLRRVSGKGKDWHAGVYYRK